MAFQAELVLEGSKIASTHWRTPQVAKPGRLIATVGSGQHSVQLADQPLERPPGQPLVGQDDQPWAQDALAGGPVQQHLFLDRFISGFTMGAVKG